MPADLIIHTETIEGCKICDVGVDPLDIPNVSCGHDRYDVVQAHSVDFVPKRNYDEVLGLVRDLVEHEDKGCSYDHHGYCQEHGWFETEPRCPIARGRELLGLDT